MIYTRETLESAIVDIMNEYGDYNLTVEQWKSMTIDDFSGQLFGVFKLADLNEILNKCEKKFNIHIRLSEFNDIDFNIIANIIWAYYRQTLPEKLHSDDNICDNNVMFDNECCRIIWTYSELEKYIWNIIDNASLHKVDREASLLDCRCFGVDLSGCYGTPRVANHEDVKNLLKYISEKTDIILSPHCYTYGTTDGLIYGKISKIIDLFWKEYQQQMPSKIVQNLTYQELEMLVISIIAQANIHSSKNDDITTNTFLFSQIGFDHKKCSDILKYVARQIGVNFSVKDNKDICFYTVKNILDILWKKYQQQKVSPQHIEIKKIKFDAESVKREVQQPQIVVNERSVVSRNPICWICNKIFGRGK